MDEHQLLAERFEAHLTHRTALAPDVGEADHAVQESLTPYFPM
jgi:hypothetical protein